MDPWLFRDQQPRAVNKRVASRNSWRTAISQLRRSCLVHVEWNIIQAAPIVAPAPAAIRFQAAASRIENSLHTSVAFQLFKFLLNGRAMKSLGSTQTPETPVEYIKSFEARRSLCNVWCYFPKKVHHINHCNRRTWEGHPSTSIRWFPLVWLSTKHKK
jgi:hypothetical protein